MSHDSKVNEFNETEHQLIKAGLLCPEERQDPDGREPLPG
jgi:hypothetical protein